MKLLLVFMAAMALAVTACKGGCDLGKIKDRAMEYKDKVPLDKIPTKIPK